MNEGYSIRFFFSIFVILDNRKFQNRKNTNQYALVQSTNL